MRDEFKPKIKEALGKRASFICSRPECRALTLYPSKEDPEKFLYVGKAAHIYAAAAGGPRYREGMTSEERSSIDNGIFLCSTCADLIDTNEGRDFPDTVLLDWRRQHEQWVRQSLNRSPWSPITVLDGTHEAVGHGRVTAIDAEGPVLFQPGTRARAEGTGEVTATRIGGSRKET